MLWLLLFAQDILPLIVGAVFGIRDYLLGLSLLNVCYLGIIALVLRKFPQSNLLQFRLLGLGLSALLVFVIPKTMLNSFEVVVSLSGILYKMFESVQIITMIFQFSRKLKEKMDVNHNLWGGLILVLTFLNFILMLLCDYHIFSVSVDVLISKDSELLKYLRIALLLLQALAVLLTLRKANYDSVILNSVAFGFYLSLIGYNIFSQKGVFSSECELSKYTTVRGIIDYFLFDKEKVGLKSIRDCVSISLIPNIVIPISVYLFLPLTFSEWKLFWTGVNKEKKQENTKDEFTKKIIQIGVCLVMTDFLLLHEHSMSFSLINLFIGTVFFVLKVFVADVYIFE